jgi:hypothetical protein
MTHLLLTGAGFSKNWGGLLASEVFNDLLSAGELDQATRDMLYKANEPQGGGFEAVLARLQGATDPANVKRCETLTSVLAGIFNMMGNGFMQRQFEFAAIPDTRYSLTPFLHRFDTIFTLNQDTLIEQKYLPGQHQPARSPARSEVHEPLGHDGRGSGQVRDDGAQPARFSTLPLNPAVRQAARLGELDGEQYGPADAHHGRRENCVDRSFSVIEMVPGRVSQGAHAARGSPDGHGL